MTNIVVRFTLEGTHTWPDAPDEYKLLRARHGHNFLFECHIPVTHSDREMEFLKVRRELVASVRSSFKGEPCDFRANSCEALAEHVANTIFNKYERWPTKVAVFEDEFVGAEWLGDR